MTVNEYKETACATPDDVDAGQAQPQDSENLLGRVLAGKVSDRAERRLGVRKRLDAVLEHVP